MKVFLSSVFNDAYFPSECEDRIKIKTPSSDIKLPVAQIILDSFGRCCILGYWNSSDSPEELRKVDPRLHWQTVRTSHVGSR